MVINLVGECANLTYYKFFGFVIENFDLTAKEWQKLKARRKLSLSKNFVRL